MIFFCAVCLAHIYARDIVYFYSLIVSIILHSGLVFISHFWKNFREELGTRVDLRITFHLDQWSVEQTIQVLDDSLYFLLQRSVGAIFRLDGVYI